MTVLLRFANALPAGLRRRLSLAQTKRTSARKFTELLTRPLRHRDLKIMGGAAAGARINLGGSYLRYLTGDAEPVLQKELVRTLKPGQVVYDVGANIGFFTIICARLVGPEGHVYAFEPMPDNAATLRHNVAINGLANVTVVEQAASSSTGTAQLAISQWSAFHALDIEGVNPRAGSDGRLTVQTLTLDDFVARAGTRPPDLVKIDVEGAELQVVEGMAGTITAGNPLLLCELHGTNLAYMQLLKSLGYNARALDVAEPVAEAHWNVHTLGWPARADAAR